MTKTKISETENNTKSGAVASGKDNSVTTDNTKDTNAGMQEQNGPAPKKKKIIIVTNNSANRQETRSKGAYSSGSAGQGQQRKPRKQGGNSRNSGAAGTARGKMEAQKAYRPIKPTITPTRMEVDYHKPEDLRPAEPKAAEIRTEVVKPAEVRTAEAKPVAAPVQTETRASSDSRTTERRPAGQSGNRSGDGSRSQSGNRSEGSRSAGQSGNRTGGDSGRSQYGSRDGSRSQYGNRSEGGRSAGQYSNRTGDGNNRTGAPRTGSYGSRGAGYAGGTRTDDRRGPGRGPAQGGTGSRGFSQDRSRRVPGRDTGAEPFVKEDKKRDENKRKIGQEKDKRSKKDLIYSEEAERSKKNRPGRFIKPEKKPEVPVEEQIKTISVPERIDVRELAEKMRMQPAEIIKKMFLKGQVMTVNSELSYEEAEAIALEYEILCEKEEKIDVIEELLKEADDNEADMTARPPVICVMGHVDHGKTSLLDAIRKTSVTDREAGGITQHIGAYTIQNSGRSITFLDTPGHEAFTAMRMRGANSTDIAVLVVAADDGVMPQTIEAINHAKAAGVEIIVAINKVDKPTANVDRVKQELTEYELISTDWGGSTEFVQVSAKTGQGIEDLLETILLTADIMELKANANRNARGLVLEAKLDKGRGPVANVLVQKGTLRVGDFISAGASSGKVRAMVDDKGRRVKEARPSQPVEVLGLSDVPGAGETLVAHENEKTAKNYAAIYKAQHKADLIEETKMRMSLDDLFSQMKEGNLKEFDLIIKADVQGSAEALKQSLIKLSNEEVIVKVIHEGVGTITESDISLASASNAVVIGFNVKMDSTAKAMADAEGVDVRMYKVIYQAIDEVEAALKGMRAPVYEEKVIGHAEVRQIFKASSVGNIAGSYVTDGVFQRNCKIRITRGKDQIYEGALASLKRFKDDVKEVKEGYECGLVFEDFDKMQVGDIAEGYILVEVPRT